MLELQINEEFMLAKRACCFVPAGAFQRDYSALSENIRLYEVKVCFAVWALNVEAD